MGHVCVLLGLFDGLHLGHMSAVNELLHFGGERVVYTFDSLSVSTKGGRKLLMTDKEKREALIKLGVDRVVSEDFLKIKDIPGREFAEKILCRELNAEKVIVGENFRFGKGASDGAQELKSYCEADLHDKNTKAHRIGRFKRGRPPFGPQLLGRRHYKARSVLAERRKSPAEAGRI